MGLVNSLNIKIMIHFLDFIFKNMIYFVLITIMINIFLLIYNIKERKHKILISQLVVSFLLLFSMFAFSTYFEFLIMNEFKKFVNNNKNNIELYFNNKLVDSSEVYINDILTKNQNANHNSSIDKKEFLFISNSDTLKVMIGIDSNKKNTYLLYSTKYHVDFICVFTSKHFGKFFEEKLSE